MLDYKPFQLSDKFLARYKNEKPPFGFNGLGELVYMRTYSRIKENGENELWWETIKRVVEGTYNMQKKWIEHYGLEWNAWQAQRSAQEMFDRIFNMKFLPPGRGLWAMGSPITEEKELFAALNNCLAFETKILTKRGFKEIGELVGSEQTIMTKNGKWVDAPIYSFGVQPLKKIIISRQGISKEIYATEDHIWFAKSPSEISHNRGYSEYKTSELKEGFRLQYLFGESPKNFSPQGIQHGICFGDGTYDHLYLVGEKDGELLKWFPNNQQTVDDSKNAIRVAHLPSHYKNLPSIDYDRKYLYGWLMGYFAADGSVDKKGQITISSSKKSNLEFVQDVCGLCGIGTYNISLSSTSSNFSEERELWKLTFMADTMDESFFLIEQHRNNFEKEKLKRYWNVVSVEDTDRIEEVFCAVVEETESFVIEGNILTHNCAFVSTDTIKEDLSEPFTFLMDASMLGVGVGFDTKGAGKIEVKGIDKTKTPVQFQIPDTREGWVESVGMLINNYFTKGNPIEFDYSVIRKAGEPIRGFGGVSAGPEPLMELHKNIISVLDKNVGEPITATTIVDIQNYIGKAVVAGNVRRTAEIAFGEPYDEEYLDLKNYEVNPHRAEYGWTSNNSIFAELGMDYSNAAERTKYNGEPGYVWLDNIKSYSRMRNGMDHKDHRAQGTNPCVEQSLESYEMCCLVETFPNNHDDVEDYMRTLKFAYLYAKTVTLGKTHWPKTNRVMLRNRRIGCSASGIAQFITQRGHNELRKWMEAGYDTIQHWDEVYSEWLAIPRSIKTTSIKPSGTVSLLAGATPGIHYPISRFYIRRMRLSKRSKLIKPLKKAGYKIEDAFGDETNTAVVEIPVDAGKGIRTIKEVSMWEQLSLAAFIQRYWADNQVSATITFDQDIEGDQIAHALNYFQYQLKGVSFLPLLKEDNPYPQMPYEEIDEKTYHQMLKGLKEIDFTHVVGNEAIVEKFCSGDSCEFDVEMAEIEDSLEVEKV